jgi:hypothetical protein
MRACTDACLHCSSWLAYVVSTSGDEIISFVEFQFVRRISFSLELGSFLFGKKILMYKTSELGRCSLVDSLFLYVFALVFYISCSKIQNLR